MILRKSEREETMSGIKNAVKDQEVTNQILNLIFGMTELAPLIEVVAEMQGLKGGNRRPEYNDTLGIRRLVWEGYQGSERLSLSVQFFSKTGEIEVSFSNQSGEVYAVI